MRRSHFSTSHTHPKIISLCNLKIYSSLYLLYMLHRRRTKLPQRQYLCASLSPVSFSCSYLSSLFILSCTSDSATLSSWSRLFLSLLQLEALLSKAAKSAPLRTKPHPSLPPLMKNPRPVSYSFVGRDPRAFFFSISRISQPTNP